MAKHEVNLTDADIDVLRRWVKPDDTEKSPVRGAVDNVIVHLVSQLPKPWKPAIGDVVKLVDDEFRPINATHRFTIVGLDGDQVWLRAHSEMWSPLRWTVDIELIRKAD